MRDVSCVTCRAWDVPRDRSIGLRESGEEDRHFVGKEILLKGDSVGQDPLAAWMFINGGVMNQAV